MNYNEIKNKYLDNGMNDYRLRTLNDLKNVLGIDIDSIIGIKKLGANFEIFQGFLINFLNKWGLEARESIKPISVHFVKNKDDGAFLKFVYKMGEKECWLHVKGVNHYY